MKRFSPGQVVTMVVAVCAAVVLMPVAVGAATGSFTNIVDPVNAGSKARVNPTGTLWTTEVDPVTRAQAKVAQDGSRLVGSQPALPRTPWNTVLHVFTNNLNPEAVLYSGAGPARLALTAMTVAANGSSPGSVVATVQVWVRNAAATAAECLTRPGGNWAAHERFLVTVPVGESLNLTWPTGLVYSPFATAGKHLCVNVSGGGPTGWSFNVSGAGFLASP